MSCIGQIFAAHWSKITSMLVPLIITALVFLQICMTKRLEVVSPKIRRTANYDDLGELQVNAVLCGKCLISALEYEQKNRKVAKGCFCDYIASSQPPIDKYSKFLSGFPCLQTVKETFCEETHN